jgi:ATP-dependent DNA ligase
VALGAFEANRESMEYGDLVAVYRDLEATDSNLQKTATLARAFAAADADTLPAVILLARGSAFAAWQSADLGVSSNLTLRAVAKATGVDADRIEAEWRDTGDLGDAAAWAVANQRQRTLFGQSLTVASVLATLREIAGYEGTGSEDRRIDAVAGLVSTADPEAARYLVRTVLGHLRLGVGEGTVRDAIAEAFLDGSDAAVEAVERAHQVTTDFRVVAETARDAGIEGLRGLDVEIGRPVKVMLASKAEGLAAGVRDVADDPTAVLAEYKFDGVRVQIHVDGDDVHVFTRRLEDVTDQFPEVVAAVREGVTVDRCVLDGEAVGYDPETGDPVAFQEFSRRIKRKYDVAELAAEIPATVHLFDALVVGSETLFDEPLSTRLDRLDGVLSPVEGGLERATSLRLAGVAGGDARSAGSTPGTSGASRGAGHGDGDGDGDGDSDADAAATDDVVPAGASPDADATDGPEGDGGGGDGAGDGGAAPDADDPVGAPPDARLGSLRAFYEEALAAGHEGVMVKNLAATYQPGRRVGYVTKVKPAMEPLDLVVTRAQWSEGRRSDFLGRLYLACRDDEADRFREVGRLSTGYTDEELRALTERLEPLIVAEDGRAVDLRPAVVLEVEYEEIQRSPEYDSGYALRFPRFLGVREDVAPTDADTQARVERLYDRQ